MTSSSGKKACIPQVAIDLKPFVGKMFETLGEAKDFYTTYARKGGFSVRRSNTSYFDSNDPNVKKSQRELKLRLSVCSKEEYKSKKQGHKV